MAWSPGPSPSRRRAPRTARPCCRTCSRPCAPGFETFVEFEWNAERDATARADEVNTAFLRWLRQNRGRRFLGWLHYMDVHEPYWPPAEFRPPVPEGVHPAVARGRLAGIAERVNWSSGPPLGAA